jgi:Ser/Thr protein kinase RdoA (MazF antagonist)
MSRAWSWTCYRLRPASSTSRPRIRFHEAAAGVGHRGPRRYPHVPHASLLGHNDIAPYTVRFDGDDVAGVFDWDLAGPTTPLMELAFIAWNCVPLWRDTGDEASAERIRRICSAYGCVHPAKCGDNAARRCRAPPDPDDVGLDPARRRCGRSGTAPLDEPGRAGTLSVSPQ